MYSFSSESILKEFLENVSANCSKEEFKEWCDERNNVFEIVGSKTLSSDELIKIKEK